MFILKIHLFLLPRSVAVSILGNTDVEFLLGHTRYSVVATFVFISQDGVVWQAGRLVFLAS